MPEASYIEIRFEDLIDNPEREVGSICNFLGIEQVNEMTQIDLTRHNIGRWKSQLTQEDSKFIENTYGDIFSKYYPKQ